MGKKVAKKELNSRASNNNDDEVEALIQDRTSIAHAVLHNDVNAMADILHACLPIKGEFTVDSVEIQKSVGESFTGGRSTPVYFVRAQVCRSKQPPKQRRFVVKLVCMPGNDNDPTVLRRRESYAVERRFYDTTGAASRVRAANLQIPRLLASDLNGTKPWPVLCILMNDLSVQYPIHPDF